MTMWNNNLKEYFKWFFNKVWIFDTKTQNFRVIPLHIKLRSIVSGAKSEFCSIISFIGKKLLANYLKFVNFKKLDYKKLLRKEEDDKCLKEEPMTIQIASTKSEFLSIQLRHLGKINFRKNFFYFQYCF